MPPIVFVDTETTSLRPDRRAWDIAVIVPGATRAEDQEYQWFVSLEDLDLGNADPMSLRVGGFYDRHPHMTTQRPGSLLAHEWSVLTQVEKLTRGAHLVGAVPAFDAEVLANRMRAHGICPSWHHHLIDVEALAVGYLIGKHGPRLEDGTPRVQLPWNSEELSRAVGVEPPGAGERHTALGDARWARDLYEVIAPWR